MMTNSIDSMIPFDILYVFLCFVQSPFLFHFNHFEVSHGVAFIDEPIDFNLSSAIMHFCVSGVSHKTG